ncbi:unnamed protein product [Rhizophagus irregularis]|nr:unnamed protein product [Rhizophagus irregularis]
MEFINAPIVHSDLATKSHPKAYHTSRLLDFTSEKLNEILESENLDNYIIKDSKSLDIKADENTSENLNEILESEDSQASVKVNEQLVSDDLNDIIKDLKSLDIKADENTSENLNEILETQASVKVNEQLVSEDLNDYIIKDLKSLDEN